MKTLILIIPVLLFSVPDTTQTDTVKVVITGVHIHGTGPGVIDIKGNLIVKDSATIKAPLKAKPK